MATSVLMIGDVVGKPGRRVVDQQLRRLRKELEIDLVVANAENAAGGSGLTGQIFAKLLSYGVDGVTLGDHVYREADIIPTLQSAANIVRPANLPESAPGNRFMKLTTADGGKSLYVMTVLGRMFMNGPPADDPFAAVELVLHELPGDAPVLVEVHAEATSEKVAMGHYMDGRVAAVVGTHTHIPTADAKILPKGTAYITDLGMTGPYDSVLGRRKDQVVQFMTTSVPVRFGVAEDDVRMCGVHIVIENDGRCSHCQRVEAAAEMDRAPFDSD